MSTAHESPEPFDARAELDRAARLADTARARGWRWVRTYLSGWAAGSVGLVLLIGLGGRTGMIVGVAAWVVLVAAGVVWSARQGFIVPAARRRIGIGAGTWAATYGIVLAVGLPTAPDDARFWVPAALVSAVPLLLAAWWPAQDGRTEATRR